MVKQPMLQAVHVHGGLQGQTEKGQAHASVCRKAPYLKQYETPAEHCSAADALKVSHRLACIALPASPAPGHAHPAESWQERHAPQAAAHFRGSC